MRMCCSERPVSGATDNPSERVPGQPPSFRSVVNMQRTFMTETKFFPRRLLWVDAQPSALDQAGRYFRAHHLAVRFVDNFEEALVEVDTRSPHLLLLDYDMPTSAMAYETFVHARLPLVAGRLHLNWVYRPGRGPQGYNGRFRIQPAEPPPWTS